MRLVSRLLTDERVLLDVDVVSKKRVFEHVALMFENTLGLSQRHVYDALFARERLGSTGLGQGIAVPHGRMKTIREAVGALVRTRQPIAFEAPDGNPVQLLFVLLVPEKANEVHLQILSELAEMFSDRALRADLLAAPEAAVARRHVVDWEPHAPTQHRAAV
ncbi:MAG: PTS sugar transporter subunit IIA [Burkholderiales bacterium]|jgi:nitrogen PTS system EIIA component|nr:PTS sugar transporter subunit IIA [Burkholderiales bacterium]